MKRNSYFVYWYRNPLKDSEIFYVGYGDHKRKCGGCRAKDHLNEVQKGIVSTNKHKYYTIKKILNAGKLPIIRIIKDNLTKDEAVSLEKKLRKKYKDTLTNIADGGNGGDTFSGQSNYKKRLIRKKLKGKQPTRHSEQWKRKLSKMRMGKGNPFFGKKHTKENKWKFGSYYRGKKISQELIDKRQTLSVYHILTPTNRILIFYGRKKMEMYFKEMNGNKRKYERISSQILLKNKITKGYSLIKVESIKKLDIPIAV